MKKKIFYVVGGSRPNYRAGQLVEGFKKCGGEGVFLVSACPNEDDGELISILTFLKKRGIPEESIYILGANDSLKNVDRKKIFPILSRAAEIIMSTEPYHYDRFEVIFNMYYIFDLLRFWLKRAFETLLFRHTNSLTPPQNIKNKVKFIPSGGEDVGYARKALWIYKIFSPYPLYWLTKYVTRREEYKHCSDGTVEEIARRFQVHTVDKFPF